MASSRAGILSEGALYETIARGNKDNYFMSKSYKDSLNPFESRYVRRPGHVSEIRQTVPLNAPDFGRTCEFEFEIAGDVFLDCTLLIDLPSWLPAVETTLNQTSGYYIATPNGEPMGIHGEPATFYSAPSNYSKIRYFSKNSAVTHSGPPNFPVVP